MFWWKKCDEKNPNMFCIILFSLSRPKSLNHGNADIYSAFQVNTKTLAEMWVQYSSYLEDNSLSSSYAGWLILSQRKSPEKRSWDKFYMRKKHECEYLLPRKCSPKIPEASQREVFGDINQSFPPVTC